MSLLRSRCGWWLFLGLALPLPVWAHGSLPGAGAFFNGLVHPFLAPAHALSLAALGLMVGGPGTTRKAWPAGALLLGLLVGALLARALGDPNTDAALLLLALVCSVMAAFQWPGPRGWATVLAFAVGNAVALGSGDPALRGAERINSLLAGCLGAAVLTAQVAYVVDELVTRRGWQPALIGVRIVSAWMSAITLMLFALSVK